MVRDTALQPRIARAWRTAPRFPGAALQTRSAAARRRGPQGVAHAALRSEPRLPPLGPGAAHAASRPASARQPACCTGCAGPGLAPSPLGGCKAGTRAHAGPRLRSAVAAARRRTSRRCARLHQLLRALTLNTCARLALHSPRRWALCPVSCAIGLRLFHSCCPFGSPP